MWEINFRHFLNQLSSIQHFWVASFALATIGLSTPVLANNVSNASSSGNQTLATSQSEAPETHFSNPNTWVAQSGMQQVRDRSERSNSWGHGRGRDRNRGRHYNGYGAGVMCTLSEGALYDGRPNFIPPLNIRLRIGESATYNIRPVHNFKTIGTVRAAFDGTTVALCNAENADWRQCVFLQGDINAYRNGFSRSVASPKLFILGKLECRYY